LHWHGFRNAIPFYDGVPESSIAVAIDHDFTYVYRPQDSGTYMYHCHFEDVEHVTMGMHGIVFVKPNPARLAAGVTQAAYGLDDGDTTGETKYDREYAIMLNEIDTRAHFGDAHIQETNWTDFHADIWTMNGRAYPDTLEPNGIRDADGNLIAQSWDGTYAGGKPSLAPVVDGRLADNPLSSMVMCSPGERVLIRFANLGMINHTIVFPGLSVDVLGRDARYVPPTAQRKATDSIQIGPGESRDVFFTAPAEGRYAFYDRGMSHYRGSADTSDAWVGGQRSDVVVVAGLAKQEKPNGWPGEVAWHGEFPLPAYPAVAVTGERVTTGSLSQRGPHVRGTVVPHPGTSKNGLWRFTGAVAPTTRPTGNTSSGGWTFVNSNSTTTFDIRMGSLSTPVSTYWILARDTTGAFSEPVSVTV
jgi:plastocyanin